MRFVIVVASGCGVVVAGGGGVLQFIYIYVYPTCISPSLPFRETKSTLYSAITEKQHMCLYISFNLFVPAWCFLFGHPLLFFKCRTRVP